MNRIITAGSQYVDIDVLSSSIAYNDLLIFKKHKGSVHLTGPLNSTIISEINGWCSNLFSINPPLKSQENKFVLVDISNPEYVENFVILENVIEVFDHHFGYEEFWKQRIGAKAKIEPVGACATLIWEQYKDEELEKKISPLSALLLYTAIVSNTLNFNAQITSKRDLIAVEEIKSLINIPVDWINHYYHESEQSIRKNLRKAIKTDTKFISLKPYSFMFSQLELWNAADFFKINEIQNINQIMNNLFTDSNWLLSISSIKENRNYIFSNIIDLINTLSGFLNIDKQHSYWINDRLWMRKEILRELLIKN